MKGQNFPKEKYLFTLKSLIEYLKDIEPFAAETLSEKYNQAYFQYFGLWNEGHYSPWKRAMIFVQKGVLLKSKLMLLFFYLPIIFPNNTASVWNSILKKFRHTEELE
jgi:hypothetical protein